MNGLLVIILLIIFSAIVSIFISIREAYDNSKKYLGLKPQLDSLNEQKSNFEKDKNNSEIKLTKREESLKKEGEKVKNEIEILYKQKSMGFPWLAEAYADYLSLRDSKKQKYLETKSHPALRSAEVVKEIKQEKRILVKENKVLDYKLAYLQKLFPWLEELIAEDEDDVIPVSLSGDDKIDKEDPVSQFLTPEEYKKLPSVERNQMALDRYLKNRNKSKWAIGRDYEMYVGYLFSEKGYQIEYKGIIDGFDDLGRDIIAKKGSEVCIIQCKRWAHFKEIHEKHIFQLFGTVMEYWIQNSKNDKQTSFEVFSNMINDEKIRPIFFTSTKLSTKAKYMADALSVEVEENHQIQDFPRIKCNINTDEFGSETKIYHLPMDQQYDRTIIGNRKGEFYAFTVKEAEDAGFRRAFKHNFNN